MSSILRLVLLREIPEDGNLRQQWNALAAIVPHPQVFYTYDWALAVQRAYSATLHPMLFLGYDAGNSLRAVAALALDDANRVSFLCATTGDYCDFLSLPEHKTDFLGSAVTELRKQGISELTLTNLPADSETVAALRQAGAQNGYHLFSRTAYRCAQIVLAKLERRQGKTKPYLPRRKMVRHSLNMMGREGTICFDHVRSWETAQSILPEFVRTHVGRFLYTGRISNLARPERRRFLEELAKLLAESGWLAMSRLMVGNHCCAWNYGFNYQGAWFWYQPTFDSNLEKSSPGFCLLTRLIEDAAEKDEIKIVDMGLGAEEYKDRLANESRETLHVTLKTSAAQHYREILRYYAAETVRRFPSIERLVRLLRQRVSQLRTHLAREGAAGTAKRVGRRLRELFWLQTEVHFYEFSAAAYRNNGQWQLVALSLDGLASAACQYVDDPSTLHYLLRAAARLRDANALGYGLVDSEGKFLHFAWARDFDGFYLSELHAKVDAPSPDCVMVFDCWTPASERGRGYYGRAIAMVADAIRKGGNRPWIFSAADNHRSVRGVEKTGFERRYTLTRQRLVGMQWIKGRPPRLHKATVEEASARVSRCG